MNANARRRKMISRVAETLCALAVVLALIPLAMILFYVIKEGVGALNVAFFTQMPKPVGEVGGGMAFMMTKGRTPGMPQLRGPFLRDKSL